MDYSSQEMGASPLAGRLLAKLPAIYMTGL